MMIRKQPERIWIIAFACFCGAGAASCDSDGPFHEKDQTGGIPLLLSAAITGMPATKAPDAIEGTAFPESSTFVFGMSFTREGGGDLVEGSGLNMQSTLTRGSAGTPDTWNHASAAGTALELKADPGQRIVIKGYYPWTDGATATAVPFDLSTGMGGQKDLLYLSSPAAAVEVPNTGKVALKFSHAYTRVRVNLTKLTDKTDVSAGSVSIDNRHANLGWIKNKGTVNPATGDVNVDGATAGPLTVTLPTPAAIPLKGGVAPALTFDFFAPSFMDAGIKDDDVVIRITTADGETLSFPLKKANLNSSPDGTASGFMKGRKNTYDIIYNNASMQLELSGWQSQTVTEGSLGGGGAYTPWRAQYSTAAGDQLSWIYPLPQTDQEAHLYHTYMGEVAGGNNGEYRPVDSDGTASSGIEWRKYTDEKVYPDLMVARGLAGGGAPVVWKDAGNGVLLAKQLCRNLREGGYRDWRLPRITELFILYRRRAGVDLARTYWSSTEYDDGNVFVLHPQPSSSSGEMIPRKSPKAEGHFVRCVRDYDKPKS